MTRLPVAFVLLALASGSAGCCFGSTTPVSTPPPITTVPAMPPVVPPPTMPLPMPGMPVPGAALPGAGMLPTSPLSFVGIEGPMPIVGAPVGTPGEILTSGTATVRIASGTLPGVASGTVCGYAQFRVDQATHGFDCRWNVTCGTSVVYGSGTAGYQVCSNPAWPPGVLMMDPSMTSTDGDGMFIFNAGGMTIGDDTGALGPFSLTMTVP
jgi:hypothetical protein